MNTLHRSFHPALSRANRAKHLINQAGLRTTLLAILLLGELNVQAGEPGNGYSLILDAARKQRDALLYRRAVDVALQARSGDAALSAARAWAQDLPQSPEANRFVLQILLALNRVGETGPVLRAILDRSSPTERTDTLNAIPQIFARVLNKTQALAVVRDALAAGQMATAAQLLGRPYAISGHVVHGRKLGRVLGARSKNAEDGFRTLNLRFAHWKPAASGIFAVRVYGLADCALSGVANLGIRPSLDPHDANGGRVLLETHCLEWPQTNTASSGCLIIRWRKLNNKHMINHIYN